jgi:K+/H+ antiporter YhaU regulatory subunit KhtT
LGGFITLLSDRNVNNEKINQFEKSINKLSDRYDQQQTQINNFDKNLSIFKTAIEKDLEFIKRYIGLSQ